PGGRLESRLLTLPRSSPAGPSPRAPPHRAARTRARRWHTSARPRRAGTGHGTPNWARAPPAWRASSAPPQRFLALEVVEGGHRVGARPTVRDLALAAHAAGGLADLIEGPAPGVACHGPIARPLLHAAVPSSRNSVTGASFPARRAL